MKIKNVVKEKEEWLNKGYQVFSYDREKMIRKTKEEPEWIHFGSGNLFRIFQALYCDRLLDKGILDKGIILVGGRNSELIDRYYRNFDNLHIAVTLKADGEVEKRVVGSIAEALKIEDEERLKQIFTSPSLKVVTFTITEKGYRIDDDNHYFEHITSFLYERYINGAHPLTMSSHDNCSHNGDVLKKVIMYWAKKYDDPGFVEYLEEKVSFPIAMIDKITPRPDSRIAELLRKDGVEDIDTLPADHYLNCFVNAEESEYLVIEDDFRNGRPLWEEAGVIFTDRDTVDKVEKMKVGTCLNPVHTALAIYGCLLDHHLVYEEMSDEPLRKLAMHIGYDEGLPVVVNPKIIDPKQFLDTVINVRLPNPYMPDAPQRIAMDTSQKIPVRFGETLKSYISKGEDIGKLTYIPLVFAGWLRYLTGINDKGEAFEPSSDPLLEELMPVLGRFRLGNTVKKEDILDILQNDSIFGVDLNKYGLADKVVSYLNEELSEAGAVRKTLNKYV